MSFLDDTAIVGASLVAILTSGGAFAARAWHGIRETGRKTDLQNRLLFGDGTDENPGLGKYMTRTTRRLDNLDAGQLETLRRLKQIDGQLLPNGGTSIRDQVDKNTAAIQGLSQMLSATARKRDPTSRTGDEQ